MDTRSTSTAPRTAVLLLAAGEGRRVGAGTNKVLLPMLGAPVFTWSVRVALTLPHVVRVVLVVRRGDRAAVDAGLQQLGSDHPGAEVWVVTGGETRHASEWNGLRVIADAVDDGAVDVVAVHDTARPLADQDLFDAVVRTAHRYGGALPVRPQRSLVPREGAGRPQNELLAVQTPQAFRAAPLLAAYRAAERDGFTGTDTAACVAAYTDVEIRGVPSPATNVKITYPHDVSLAERLLRRRMSSSP